MKNHMSRADRAKQFAPFAALKGYEEAVRRQEELYCPRPILGEDAQTELDTALRRLRKGAPVTVTYYANGKCLTVKGAVSKIDAAKETLAIGETPIAFYDLLNIEI